jgi:hypothetical protein
MESTIPELLDTKVRAMAISVTRTARNKDKGTGPLFPGLLCANISVMENSFQNCKIQE